MDQLQAFIQQQRIRGVSDTDTAGQLLSAGWEPDAVRQAMASLGPQNSVIPSVSQPHIQPAPSYDGSKRRVILISVAIIVAIIFVIGIASLLIGSSGGGNSAAKLTPEGSLIEQGERDTIRKELVNKVALSAEDYSAENRGRYPEATQDGWDTLVSGVDGLSDPLTKETYQITDTEPGQAQIQYSRRVTCDVGGLKTGTPRSYAIRIQLESGGVYCIDNQNN